MEDFTIENKIIALFGKRCSGKSYLLKYLTNCERDLFKKIFIVCPTESINKFYSSMVPDDCIYDSYNNDWCMKLIKKLTDIKTSSKQVFKTGSEQVIKTSSQ